MTDSRIVFQKDLTENLSMVIFDEGSNTHAIDRFKKRSVEKGWSILLDDRQVCVNGVIHRTIEYMKNSK